MVLKSSRACMTKSIVSTIRLSTSFKTALYLTYQLAREYNISRLSLLTYPPDSTFWPFVIRRVAFSMPVINLLDGTVGDGTLGQGVFLRFLQLCWAEPPRPPVHHPGGLYCRCDAYSVDGWQKGNLSFELLLEISRKE